MENTVQSSKMHARPGKRLLAVLLFRSKLLLILLTVTFAAVFVCLKQRHLLLSEQGNGIFVLFLAPKPGFGEAIPDGITAWRNELTSVKGEIILLLNDAHDIHLARREDFRTERIQESERGFPLLPSILEVISKYHTSRLVGFCNSDLLPGNHFSTAIKGLSLLNTYGLRMRTVDSDIVLQENFGSKGWLVVVSRVDFKDTPGDGRVHRAGGVDMWIWNNIDDHNNIFGIDDKIVSQINFEDTPLSGHIHMDESVEIENWDDLIKTIDSFNNSFRVANSIPAFSVGRPFFDNWLTATAMQLGGRQVIDGTGEIQILHRKHNRTSNWNDANYFKGDDDWLQNKKLASVQVCVGAKRCAQYRLGRGTTCEAPYYLVAGVNKGNAKTFNLRSRRRIVPCHSCQDCYDH